MLKYFFEFFSLFFIISLVSWLIDFLLSFLFMIINIPFKEKTIKSILMYIKAYITACFVATCLSNYFSNAPMWMLIILLLIYISWDLVSSSETLHSENIENAAYIFARAGFILLFTILPKTFIFTPIYNLISDIYSLFFVQWISNIKVINIAISILGILAYASKMPIIALIGIITIWINEARSKKGNLK